MKEYDQDSSSRFFTDIFTSVKWIFPRAPFRFVQNDDNEETVETQWFDMATPQHPQEEVEMQRPGLLKSVHLVLDILRQETEMVGMQNVVLAGIS